MKYKCIKGFHWSGKRSFDEGAVYELNEEELADLKAQKLLSLFAAPEAPPKQTEPPFTQKAPPTVTNGKAGKLPPAA